MLNGHSFYHILLLSIYFVSVLIFFCHFLFPLYSYSCVWQTPAHAALNLRSILRLDGWQFLVWLFGRTLLGKKFVVLVFEVWRFTFVIILFLWLFPGFLVVWFSVEKLVRNVDGFLINYYIEENWKSARLLCSSSLLSEVYQSSFHLYRCIGFFFSFPFVMTLVIVFLALRVLCYIGLFSFLVDEFRPG